MEKEVYSAWGSFSGLGEEKGFWRVELGIRVASLGSTRTPPRTL